MLTYPDIEPVAWTLGPLKIHWYGITYVVAFVAAWWLGHRRARQSGGLWTVQQSDDLIFYGAIGAVVGGRLGYMLFYGYDALAESIFNLFRVWEGGMSFHGGLLGAIGAIWWFARRHQRSFFQVADFGAPLIPLGIAAVRIGNFINGELWGKASSLPWAMRLPCDDARFSARFCDGAQTGFSPALHPSMLYESLFEGFVLFAILWWFTRQPRPVMAASGVFLLGYGVFRFAIEFVRLPDSHIGYLAFNWVTMGHILSAPMILAGLIFLVWAYSRSNGPVASSPSSKA